MTAERNVQLAFIQFVGARLAFLNFQIVEARAKHLHRHIAILALAALRLARHHDIGWKMGDADSGLHFIDVLSSLASRTESVDAQVFRTDVDLDAVVNFWDYEDGCKRSVPPCRLIEGGDSNEPMNAGFSREKAISIFAGKLNRGRFDASFFTRSLIEYLGGRTPALRPSQVHTKKDGSPILRFRPAGAGLYGHDGVEMVGLSGKQCSGLQLRDKTIGGVEFAVQLFQQVVLLLDIGLFLREMDVGLDVAGDGGELLVRGDLFFGALAFAENALGGFLIVPEIGVGNARFESFQTFAVLRRVKDSSGRDSCAA